MEGSSEAPNNSNPGPRYSSDFMKDSKAFFSWNSSLNLKLVGQIEVICHKRGCMSSIGCKDGGRSTCLGTSGWVKSGLAAGR